MASTRRLAAILADDVAGYSRLMGADEEGTLERLKAHRRQLIDPMIVQGMTPQQIDQELARLRDIEHQVAYVEVPLSYMEEFYHLRLHLAMVHENLEKLKAQQGTS